MASLSIRSLAISCSGTISDGIVGSIEIGGSAECVLNNVEVTGAVTLLGRARLFADRGSQIGSVQATMWNGNVTITSSTVLGNVSLDASSSAATMSVLQSASIAGEIRSSGPVSLTISGIVGNVVSSDATLSIKNGTTGRVEITGASSASFCNANVTKDFVITATTKSVVTSTDTGCVSSTISKLIATGGSDNINLSGVKLGTFSVVGRSGQVSLMDSTAKDITINDTVGNNVVLNKVTVEGRALLSGNGEDVRIAMCSGGEIISILNKKITNVVQNTNFRRLEVQENRGRVEFIGNTSPTGVAFLTRNTGGADVFNNMIAGLTCIGNVPRPVGQCTT